MNHAARRFLSLPTGPFLGSKAGWVEVRADARDRLFEAFPDESIADWHRRLGLEREA